MITQNLVSVYCQPSATYDLDYIKKSVENILIGLGLDKDNWGSSAWNPLSELINPGDTVVLKPNLISHSHATRESWEEVITHPSIIFAITEYVYKALRGKGSIVITDGPQTSSDFEKISHHLRFNELMALYPNTPEFSLNVFDLRKERWIEQDGVIVKKVPLPGDKNGYSEIDLETSSEFVGHINNRKYYGAEYNYGQTQSVHSDTNNKYLISSTVLDADVVINIPKFKTHKKAGLTLSLKNMVGINGDKNYLPHHTMGTPDQGGDEFEKSSVGNSFQGWLVRIYKRALTFFGGTGGVGAKLAIKLGYAIFGRTDNVIRSGNWYGNDTLWRMVLDLNKILFYYNASGKMLPSKRRYLTVIDGIVAGENNGPSAPDRKECGLIIGGFNPVAADMVAARIAGFDFRRIPTLNKAFEIQKLPLCQFKPSDITVTSNRDEFNDVIENLPTLPMYRLQPHFRWKGHIELNK